MSSIWTALSDRDLNPYAYDPREDEEKPEPEVTQEESGARADAAD